MHRESGRLKHAPTLLDDEARRIVYATIVAHCRIREWELLALNVRSNHVHIVVSAATAPPEQMMAQFKAWASRRLREAGLASATAQVWTYHGSTRYLWNRESVNAAVNYVTEHQGVDLI